MSKTSAQFLDVEEVMGRVVHGVARDPMRIDCFGPDRDLRCPTLTVKSGQTVLQGGGFVLNAGEGT